MTIPQINYPDDMPKGIEGQSADIGSDNHIRTRVNVTNDMEFGRGVSVGVNDDEVILPTNVAAAFAGVTHFSHSGSDDTTQTGIPAKTPANIKTKGRILVLVETAVTPASQVHMRHANAGASPEAIARFRATADGADTVRVDDVHSVKFESSAAAGGLAVLALNMP